MNYQQTVDYLFSQLPMFQRVGAAAYKADLSNTIALCDLLDNPQNKFRSIHIAGTNGKGSTASTLAAIFQASGYKTGLFTSPHLKDYRERIKINGKEVSETFVVDFVAKIKDQAEALKPSFFETTCAMAFAYFAKEKVDIAILEVGMGGRLDSTNVVTPELSVITSISKDHEQFLGNTLGEIAGEKGGIIKPNIPVVIGNNLEEVSQKLKDIAVSKSAPIYYASETVLKLETDLAGNYQQENMLTVGKAVEVMRNQGWSLPQDKVVYGAKNVRAISGLHGRWEILDKNPKIIADVGHNVGGVTQNMAMLAKEKFKHLHIVWGMVGDKDAKNILSLLPKEANYYWCKPNIPRGKEVGELAQEGRSHGLKGKTFNSVSKALEAAKINAKSDDLIFVGGSVFVVGEVI